MKKTFALWLAATVAVISGSAFSIARAQGPGLPTPEKKYEDFDKLTRGGKEYEGLFRLHQKDDHLYAEIGLFQFDKPLLCPMAIARGMGMGGHTLNFDEQWVLVFHRAGDRVQLIRRNVHFRARAGSPTAKAVETTYTDSVLMALRIQSIHPIRQSVIIDLNDIFMTDFAQLRIGFFDSSRSTWSKIKTFPRNIELEVTATYSGRGLGDDSVIDSRGNTLVLHYGLMQLPDSGYQPRLADDRVGHFLTVVKDYTSDSRDTPFLRYVNRWRLERAETDSRSPSKLAPPKKKIVYWIEKSVPDEYRAYVREGILEWNKAFEKIGFRDAIEVRQQENEDFDPEDVNYNTFRWITTDRGFAMGPSRVNPLTGEILDADIIFDASMVRYWKMSNQVFGSGTAMEEPASLIKAARLGMGLYDPLQARQESERGWNDRDPAKVRRSPQDQLWAIRHGVCQCCSAKKYEMGLAAMTLASRGELKPGDPVPEKLIGQAIKETVMHEVGHTLGLRHNFKASTMLDNSQLHDTKITQEKGLVGSVMDYNPINIAPKGVKQGDYFTTVLGPYDFWAIEYAYKPLSGSTDGEVEKLQEIASRCANGGNDYGTDEDMFGSADPLVNVWDLGSDPMKYAQDRILLAEELLKNLAEKSVDKGEGYQRTRQAFGLILRQYGDAAHLVANFIGGEYLHRDHKGDPSGRDPFVPVNCTKQRDAVKFLQSHILTDKPFQFSPELLRRLAADRWLHWGSDMTFGRGVEYPLHDRILAIQRIVLDQVYDSGVLARMQNNSLKAGKDEQALTVAELFRGMTECIWMDVPKSAAPPAKDAKPADSSIIRRNLQREQLKDLIQIVVGHRQVPADARSLARMHLREIKGRIDVNLVKGLAYSDTQRAHLEECQERIAKALNAAMQESN